MQYSKICRISFYFFSLILNIKLSKILFFFTWAISFDKFGNCTASGKSSQLKLGRKGPILKTQSTKTWYVCSYVMLMEMLLLLHVHNCTCKLIFEWSIYYMHMWSKNYFKARNKIKSRTLCNTLHYNHLEIP